MTPIRVDCYSISVDGFGTGPAQSQAHPLGRGGAATLRQCLRATHLRIERA